MKNSSMGWDKERLTELTLKYLQGELSVEEQAELEEWLKADPVNRERFEARISPESLVEGIAIWHAARESKEQARERMNPEKPVRRIYPWRRIAIAAAVLVVLLGSAIVLFLNGRTQNEPAAKIANDLPPGGSKAILTLANGSMVILDSAGKGLVARQGHSEVVKSGKGQLIYQEGNAAGDIGFNTVSTPRGGQYEVRLPDGTKIWLNASSSVRYPTAFAGDRREVEMTGEAYFDVAHRSGQPFVVKAAGREIEDIGTHFDIDAYEDEPEMRTTLLEGAVKVDDVVLRPGEQARLARKGRIEVVKDANLEEAIAWKNGLFEFNSSDIESVMRTIGRWYDVTIHYQAEKDSHRFTGQISRNATALEALQILATSGYHFNIQGKVITVLP